MTSDKTSSARRCAHVLGHNFAPFAFQEPCFGLIVVNMASYTFVPGSNVCQRRVCCWKMLCSLFRRRRDAAARGGLRCDEVSVPALACSHGNSDWWYMYTSTMLIHNGDPCVQRECAAETACCDHANLVCTKIDARTHVLGHNFAPLAFQKPRLGFLTEQTALYTFIWVLARLRPFGRDQDFTYRRMILVFIGSSAATRRLTVTRCRHRPSRFPMVSEE